MLFDLDDFILAIIYLIAVFFIFFLGKLVYSLLHRNFNLQHELFENDNVALSLAVVGYYLGMVFAIGGILYGPSLGLVNDLIDIIFWGVIAIILMNISIFINDKIILYKFRNEKEIIQDRNAGTGVVEAGNYIAVGMILAGAISGQGGDLITTVVFLLLGQVVLILAGLVYNWVTPYNIHDMIEQDNVAVGVAFAGVLIAVGNIVRIGIYGDFVSWYDNLYWFGEFAIIALVMLPVVRFITDKILLPGTSLTHELANQETPNVGAAAIEAFSYIAASMLLSWVI